jgi:tetratricopeptide (TPR) repeat protein
MTYQTHRERGGDDRHEQQIRWLKKAVEAARKSGHNGMCAWTVYALAHTEIGQGNWAQAVEYLYEAVDYYDKAEMYVNTTEALFVTATAFYEMKDLAGLERVLLQMETYFDKNRSKQFLYQYYNLKHLYFETMLEKEQQEGKTIEQQLVDTALVYIQKNIDMVENHLDELDKRWIHGAAYWHKASVLDKFRPEQTDTILLYLDKADAMNEFEVYHRTVQINVVKEFLSWVGVVRARALSRQGQWTKAHKIMTEALSLMDETQNDRQRLRLNDAYQFMADYYEKINQPAQEAKYLKLLRQSETKIYEKNKIDALNEMSIKYETEKKTMQIQMLERKNEDAKRVFRLIVGLGFALVVILILWS